MALLAFLLYLFRVYYLSTNIHQIINQIIIQNIDEKHTSKHSFKTHLKTIFKNYEIKIRPIKINKFNLRWRKVRLGFPSFFLSHTSFSILFETLSSLLCSRITYQQKTREDKTRRDETRQDKTRQDETKQDKRRGLTLRERKFPRP